MFHVELSFIEVFLNAFAQFSFHCCNKTSTLGSFGKLTA